MAENDDRRHDRLRSILDPSCNRIGCDTCVPASSSPVVLVGGLHAQLCIPCINDWVAFVKRHSVSRTCVRLQAYEGWLAAQRNAELSQWEDCKREQDKYNRDMFALSEQWLAGEVDPLERLDAERDVDERH